MKTAAVLRPVAARLIHLTALAAVMYFGFAAYPVVALAAQVTGGSAPTTPAAAAAVHVPLVFTGGRETDPRDRGRPVVLVAGALGVAPEVFRQAFSHVHPAGPNSGGPTPQEARSNKQALMSVLAKYGITNDRLDQVSNYYRYVRSRGEMWPTRSAAGYAVRENGKITKLVITDGGSGYSSTPTVTLSGANDHSPAIWVTLAYGPDFSTNGSVSMLNLAASDVARRF